MGMSPPPQVSVSTESKANEMRIVTSEHVANSELTRRARAVGKLFRVYDVIGKRKVRVGSKYDGGYIMLDDFADVTRAFSLGIERNVDWDIEIANRGIAVEQFDYSVDGPPTQHDLFKFHQVKVTTEDDGKSLERIVADAGATAGQSILKMDIEHSEWPVLDATPSSTLRRFSQIVVEFHYFDLMTDPHWWQRTCNVLSKLNSTHRLVHVHANNTAGLLLLGGVVLPNVIEASYVARDAHRFTETAELFPTDLDASNDPSKEDFYLGRFEY